VIELAPSFLRGSYPPLVTPFCDGEVDYKAYATLVERQVEGGSHGILVNGTTSEPSTLTLEERARLVEVAVGVVGNRLPVVAGTGSQSHAETLWLTDRADRAGADALMVVTPYYLCPPQRGLVAYYADLARRSELPLLAYHIPGRAAVSLEPATIEAIAHVAPTFVGMKHASTDLSLVTQVLDRLGPEFRVFVGLEELSLPMLAVGATGLMNAVGNLAPAKVAALFDAVAGGDLDSARSLHYELFELNQAIFWDTNPIPLKYLMMRLGLLSTNEHRLPMVPADAALADRLDDLLGRIKAAVLEP
jgi:4-hydroxy-tetrahydrodipicolinate synthase